MSEVLNPTPLECCGAVFQKYAPGGDDRFIGFYVHAPECPDSLKDRMNCDSATFSDSLLNGSEIVGD